MRTLGFAIILSFAIYSMQLEAYVIERYSLGKRLENATLVAIVEITGNDGIEGNGRYLERSSMRIIESSNPSMKGRDISFYHGGYVLQQDVVCCGIGNHNLVYLRPYKDGYETAAMTHGVYEIIDSVMWFVDERAYRIGRLLAEEIVFLHRLCLRLPSDND